MRDGASVALVAFLASASCGTTEAQRSRTSLPANTQRDAAQAWASITQSPWPIHAKDRDPRESALHKACGAEDLALTRVALAIARARARGENVPEPDSLAAKLRMVGEPHVRPRLFVATGRAPIDTASAHAALIRRKSESFPRMRCGIAFASAPEGNEVLVAVDIEALADMSPMPVRARTGEWLSFEAALRVPARSASLLVLGPRGMPRTVPIAFDSRTGAIHGRFALDQPGSFLVQLIGDLAEGPRPLLEARVFADTVPVSSEEDAGRAPGEDAGLAKDGVLALAQMVARARAMEGLPALLRDETLDALAQGHAERMRERGVVAHDLGDGDFLARFERDASFGNAVGENVAHAKTPQLAHRAFYASPSHRLNLISALYTHIGIGVAPADDGSVYVCETFARVQKP